MLSIHVPATSANLGSGLDSLGLALNLELSLTFEPHHALHITTSGHGAGVLPKDSSNLIWTSATHLYTEVMGFPMPTGTVEVTNHIPSSRGLGSSASAVIAGLLLANALLPSPLPREALLSYATEIEGHPDNAAAALYGGFVLVYRDHDERLRVISYPAPPLAGLLAIPDYLVPTRDARALLPSYVSRDDAVFNAQRVALWMHAISHNDWSVLRDASQDRLHQPYRTGLVRGLDELIAASYDAGAFAATLSGSGPTIMALMPQKSVAAVQAAWMNFARDQQQWSLTIIPFHPVSHAATVDFISR